MRECLLCYVTDRQAFPGDGAQQRQHLLAKISEAARYGVDYIQLREKDLSARELEILAREVLRAIREVETPRRRTALLINSRTDVALAIGAHGVHLRSDDISPQTVRQVWQCAAGTPARETSPANPVIGISCHSPAEVARAADNWAGFALFGPVFEKKDAPQNKAAGLDELRAACRSSIPVLALGGVTLENARLCVEAGAAGMAGIRLFQEHSIAEIVGRLRS